jgi:two-component system cell cycle sensor histidine kinase/response regulator CckA
MPTGGRLTFETANVVLDADTTHAHPEVLPGEYVRLTVSDTGVGMPETIQQHVFEPFFTTKEQGKGTGLGLAMCHGIVKQSGGHIWLYSEPGQGATFKIYLPRSADRVAEPASGMPAAVPARGGAETVLMVEDDALVRRFALAALRRLGYEVIEASTGEEAVRMAAELPRPPHLLFTDVVMPGMNGPETARQVRARYPGVRVPYASGYTDDIIVHHGVLARGRGVPGEALLHHGPRHQGARRPRRAGHRVR